MNSSIVAYLVIAAIVAVVVYGIQVARSADDDLIVSMTLCCTLFPMVAILLGVAWPLALLATTIRLAARD